jgi:hypothetical protein
MIFPVRTFLSKNDFAILPRRGGLFQNRETKKSLPGDQLWVKVEAGGRLPGNSHPRPDMGVTDVTAPPAFAAPFCMDFPGLSSFPHFERDPLASGRVKWQTDSGQQRYQERNQEGRDALAGLFKRNG